MLGKHQRSSIRLHKRSGSGHGRQLPGRKLTTVQFSDTVSLISYFFINSHFRPTGGPCQVSALCGRRCDFPSRAAVCVSAVCAHLPSGYDGSRLLDGSFPSGSRSRSYGLPRFEYPFLTAKTSSGFTGVAVV